MLKIIFQGQENTVRLLIEHGADINSQVYVFKTLLQLAMVKSKSIFRIDFNSKTDR